MEIYLDSGNVEEIREASKSGILDGVTTNPSLIAKEGQDFGKILREIIKLMKTNIKKDFTISAEVTNTKTAEEMIKEGRALSKIDKHILVKIPITIDGIKAVSKLSSEGIRCNMTLCFSASQALLAAKAGAWCVSPFLGRIDDEGYDGFEVLKNIKKVYDNYNFKTKILAASIRNQHHVLDCIEIGAHIATMPYPVFKKLYYNPLTDLGLEKFNNDWKEYKIRLEK